VNDSIMLNTDNESNVSINKFNLNSLLAAILSMADVHVPKAYHNVLNFILEITALSCTFSLKIFIPLYFFANY
jgi:hypothetical protein